MNPYPSSVIITFFIMELSPVPKRCCVSFQTQGKVVICPESIQHTQPKTDVGWGKKQTNKVIRTSMIMTQQLSLCWEKKVTPPSQSLPFIHSHASQAIPCYRVIVFTPPLPIHSLYSPPDTKVTDRMKKGGL